MIIIPIPVFGDVGVGCPLVCRGKDEVTNVYISGSHYVPLGKVDVVARGIYGAIEPAEFRDSGSRKAEDCEEG